jgi:hypothetical protein
MSERTERIGLKKELNMEKNGTREADTESKMYRES